MTTSELKTIREAIGLTVPDLAALAGVQERTVRYWESGRSAVPADVQDQVLKIDAWLTAQAREALATVRALAAEVGALPESIHLLRYRENADLWRFQPAYRPLPVTVHAAALARTRTALADRQRRIPRRRLVHQKGAPRTGCKSSLSKTNYPSSEHLSSCTTPTPKELP